MLGVASLLCEKGLAEPTGKHAAAYFTCNNQAEGPLLQPKSQQRGMDGHQVLCQHMPGVGVNGVCKDNGDVRGFVALCLQSSAGLCPGFKEMPA